MNQDENPVCPKCDNRGFVFVPVDAFHVKQAVCAECQGGSLRATVAAAILSGERVPLEYPGFFDAQENRDQYLIRWFRANVKDE